MKIECEVIGVETTGESLCVRMQGLPSGAAQWRGVERQTITVPTTKRNERSFHAGRRVILTVATK